MDVPSPRVQPGDVGALLANMKQYEMLSHSGFHEEVAKKAKKEVDLDMLKEINFDREQVSDKVLMIKYGLE